MIEVVYINDAGKMARLAVPTSFEEESKLRKALKIKNGDSKKFGSLTIRVTDEEPGMKAKGAYKTHNLFGGKK